MSSGVTSTLPSTVLPSTYGSAPSAVPQQSDGASAHQAMLSELSSEAARQRSIRHRNMYSYIAAGSFATRAMGTTADGTAAHFSVLAGIFNKADDSDYKSPYRSMFKEGSGYYAEMAVDPSEISKLEDQGWQLRK